MKIQVLSYNIHKGFDSVGFKFVLNEIRHALRETKADILLLQEVVGENKKHKQKIEDWPSESQFEFLADSVWKHFSYGKNAIFDERHHGNAILSKFPIIQSENINISTNRWERRGLLHAVVELPSAKKAHLHIFNVHLDLRHKGRLTQLSHIIERAYSHVPPGEPFILGGDFNDWSKSLSPMFHEHLGLYESFKNVNGDHARSFPSFLPLMSLDRVYYRNLKIGQATVLGKGPWDQLSDHLPLLVEFEVPSPFSEGGA